MPDPIRIYIVEDHPVMRDTLVEYLELSEDLEICGTAASAEEALEALPSADSSLVLVDLSLPGASGLDLLENIRRRWELPCVVLSGHKERSHLERAFRSGARGYLLKGRPEEIPVALRSIMGGEVYLAEPLRGEMEDEEVSRADRESESR